ncbi:MAG: hypothetical protein ABJA80_03805 [bacterium]
MPIPSLKVIAGGAAAGMALLAVACQRLAVAPASGAAHLSISVETPQTLGQPTFRGSWVAVVPVAPQNDVQLTSAELVVESMRMSRTGPCWRDAAEPARAAGTAATSRATDGCRMLASAPVLLTIPLNGSLAPAFGADVTVGEYRALDGRIATVSGDVPEGAQFLQRHPGFPAGRSLRAAGTYTDSLGHAHPFVFTSALDRRLAVRLAHPVDLGWPGAYVTLSVDVASWFTDDAGHSLDPSDPHNRRRIEQNILASFRAFEDDDHDGLVDGGSGSN